MTYTFKKFAGFRDGKNGLIATIINSNASELKKFNVKGVSLHINPWVVQFEILLTTIIIAWIQNMLES